MRDFYLTLDEVLKEKGVSVANAAQLCGLADSTVRSIISRKQKNVALEVAFKLSEGLGVSLERLNDMPEKEDQDPLRSRLLSSYAQLNTEGRKELVKHGELLVKSGEYPLEAKKENFTA